MAFRLTTVRAKLTALVSLSVLAMVVALPVLFWLLHRQLADEVDNRVRAAEQAFQVELEDDIADLTLASRVLAADRETVRAIALRDAGSARRLAEVFVGVYPALDVLLVEPTGRVVAQVGCEHPLDRVDQTPELAVLSRGLSAQGLLAHGCEAVASNAPPAYGIAVPIGGAGAIVVCLPLDSGYLVNSGAKLGLELAFEIRDAAGGARVFGDTPGFPRAAARASFEGTRIVDDRSRSWAVVRFDPARLGGATGGVGVVAALDVTDIRTIVVRNLASAMTVLTLAAAVSVWLGSRLATVMSRALRSVTSALERVEKFDYSPVESVRTGDELENLARGFNRMIGGLKERDKLRTTFGKYMTQAVLDHLLAGKIVLGGESLTVTILFTDIRSFTSMSERMEPHQLVALLNEYFTEMVGIVIQEDGVVDKYIGDAIMAVFGAPVPKTDDAVRAVRAAARMRTALAHLNESLELRGIAPLHTGIGIHTGEVIAGNIGSEVRMEYTVIGDAVNLAARLESSTKELGVNVLVSEDTFALVNDVALLRPIREITVKGRTRPVMTYELLAMKDELATTTAATAL